MVLTLAVLVFTGIAESQAQTGAREVIFDDFDYVNEADMFIQHAWRGDGGSTSNHVAWDRHRWDNNDYVPGLVTFDIERTGGTDYVSMTANAGSYTCFPSNAAMGCSVPVSFVGGFTRRTGTWAARVRFSDLPETGANAIPSFWLTSPYRAVYSNMLTENRWWEINYEWVNQTNQQNIPDLPILSMGANIDNEFSNVSGGLVTGGYVLSDPWNSNADPWSCRVHVNGNTFPWPIHPFFNDINFCMDGLKEDLNDEPYPFVDLMIQYDGVTLTYEVLARSWGTNNGWIYMKEEEALNKRLGPMMPVFSILTSDELPVLAHDVEMMIDWFYYTSDADMTIWDVLAEAGSFQSAPWTNAPWNGRVNLTGANLTHPTNTAIGFTLESPIVTASNQVKEWHLTPDLQNQDREYEIQWQYEYQRYPWSGIIAAPTLEGHGFTLDLEEELGFPVHCGRVRARIRYRDAATWPAWGPNWWSYNFASGTSAGCGTSFSAEADGGRKDVNASLEPAISNYPEPFNPTTRVTYSIPEAGELSVTVFDALGREVARLADGWHAIGNYDVQWDASSQPNGVYFITLRSAKSIKTIRATLLK